MSTIATALPHINGTGVVSAEAHREVDFLRQILQIRDDVFASKHPRIHLPPKVIEQVAPRPPQTTPPSRPSTNGIANGTGASQLFPPRPDNSLQQTAQAHEFVSPTQPIQRPYSAKSASSGIDPVLLTKSDHLIRAELQLKRQQIERLLKDQFDKKGRGNDNEEREAHFNVEECLIQAHLRVPPVSGLQPTTNNSDGAESFDENSYYSSKADSWSSEDVDVNQTSIADATGSLVSQGKQLVKHVLDQSRPNEPTVIDLDEEAYEPTDDIEIYEPEQVDLGDDADEEDYSPPPADIGPSEPSRGRARDRGFGNGDANGSRRNSPSGPAPPLQNPRKRRREEKRQEKRREQQANKRVVRSPEPYIKEEPQSPPPLAESQPSKRRALQPLPNDIEMMSPRGDTRMQPVYYREYDEPTSPTVIHAPQRRPQPQEQDLRRVASLQYARRPYSPGGSGGDVYAAPPEYRPIRAASHAYADRPEVPVFREPSTRASMAPRYIRERSRSPIYEPMPPPRRIVVDQYGNKYYAAPVDARESAAPPSRRIEVDPYYERAVTREPTMRAPARSDIYEDEIGQRMPPPPPRRYLAAAEPEHVDARPYGQRETSRRPVEVEYRPQELIERRPVSQYEDMGPPQYMPSRAYSVRPEVVRREVPEGYVRHESIQPGSVRASAQPRYREVSIAHPEASDRYVMAPPQSRRYVEEGPVEVAPESYPAVPRHVSYRY
ncbi:uncharacterized protein EKO05_0000718 [Ascochyta rabiei]|uniref:Uncharacterized protein n=1 Tax=Didymella rabiei TaxID=5454 RepID=A0A163B2N7_DIDRA|nr:uncharacterized protein EKO05_0000718 [Ascochyta rabiei]KZM21539.1 hypothetical protein ST47_g7291 [Ascochyta rabiei]UPX10043.1 hypothetical protein EKO05_0000718 [Ascochyta rabiei]